MAAALNSTKPANNDEMAFGVDKSTDSKESTESKIFEKDICRFHFPKKGAEEIDTYVKSKNLSSLNIKWGYPADCFGRRLETKYNRPVLYVTTNKELTETELNELEQKIRDKGIETFCGGLGDGDGLDD